MHEITPERPRLHSLAAVVPLLCADTMAHPQRWLARQILTGRIRARKIGRQWFMTDDDITYALDVFANIPATAATDIPAPADDEPLPPPLAAPTAASLRRRRRGMAAAT